LRLNKLKMQSWPCGLGRTIGTVTVMVSVETRGSTAGGRTDSKAPHERSAQFLFFIYTDTIVQTPSRQ
jgi:hypothetical protein